VGGLNEKNHLSMDYELWGELLLAGARINYTGICFGFFRWNKGQKTQDNLKQNESMLDAAAALVIKANCLSPEVKREILAELEAYRVWYPESQWKGSGRLARIGLPRTIVEPIRSVRQTVERTIRHLVRK
jgi:hypothetical protein